MAKQLAVFLVSPQTCASPLTKKPNKTTIALWFNHYCCASSALVTCIQSCLSRLPFAYACGQNYFTCALLAPEQVTYEEAKERMTVLAEVEELKKYAGYHGKVDPTF